MNSISEIEGFEGQRKKKAVSYLIEPSLNSELLLFNNSKLLSSSIKANYNRLSLNKINGRSVGSFQKKNKKDKSIDFSKVYSKLVFLKEIPKYDDSRLEEILELRKEYEKYDSDDSPGLQKIKRDIRNKIRDYSSLTYINRDKNVFGSMIMILIDRIITRPNFSGYSYKHEMKSLATEHILKYTWRFNTYRQSKISLQYISSFTYISTIIFNAFIATINKQNDEYKKAKEDFLETQTFKYKDSKQSTYGFDPSMPEKEVVISIINDTLFDEIKKIKLDCKDILIKYNNEYSINMDEYTQITEYSKDNNINMSIVRI